MDSGKHSRLTVLLALAANAGVGVLKLLAGLLTGSGALLSEAAHSAGDTGTELFLILALRRSERPADRVHPFGYGKERYFWSLIAAASIFVLGSAFSVYEGLSTILAGSGTPNLVWINFVVLGFAFCFEGVSWLRARSQAREQTRSGTAHALVTYARDPDDPTVNSVLVEDSAALIGLVIAALGVGLHVLTGSAVWDGAASLGIGALLITAAFLLARTCERLLIGKQAGGELMRAVERRLEEQPEVDDVVDLLTMRMGADEVLLCARVDFVDTFSAMDLETACVRIDGDLRAEFDELGEIFLQPVPRADPDLRERVLSRYGRVMADEAGGAGPANASQRC
jgi:cation diffusion facilitator family transporter